MTKPGKKDVAASVRARLLRLAEDRSEDFQLVLTRYVNERLLYRLSASRHGKQFVLKGAALFTLWTGRPHRATRDLDLLGFGSLGENVVHAMFTEILAGDDQHDGVHFDLGTLTAGPIREDQEYGGVRVTCIAHVTTAKVRVQVDIGIGDAITPEAEWVDFPALLDFQAPRLRVYPRETVVAEKLEAMVQLGMANSRMKDFYDLAFLAESFAFDGEILVRAIRATFERRMTPLPTALPVALSAEFTADVAKISQWRAFSRKSNAKEVGSLDTTMARIREFAMPVLAAAVAAGPLPLSWPAGGPWHRL